VPPHLAEHAEAVVREAVSNAVRHARARNLVVNVAVKDDELRINVSDDGIGIPPDVTHSGLRNLHERAEDAGGTFSVTPREGGGTHVDWIAPLR
jgi:signal transduction histidine kinase